MQTQKMHSQPWKGWWLEGSIPPNPELVAFARAALQINRPFSIVNIDGRLAVGQAGMTLLGGNPPTEQRAFPLQADVPALPPSNLGDPNFCARHRLVYPYIAGAMANGIASVEIVISMARAGMLGFFGSAGLRLEEVESAILRLKRELGDLPFGSNLIYSPNESELEMNVVSLYLRHGVRLVSASAYLDLTLPIVYYRVKGLHLDQQGQVVCPNRIIAKISREEVAAKFLAPPPEKMLQALFEKGLLSQEEVQLASRIPMADDLTAEGDSGGHTDNQPTLVLLPLMLGMRDKYCARYKYAHKIGVGLAGGIATPVSAAAAFAMGADFIVTGSINQSCIEAGTSETVRLLLAKTRQADVMMAPAADMFEMGVRVQVLKRGTMFGVRARKLYELYRSYESLEALPAAQVKMLERDYLKASLSEAWTSTKAFFAKVDPSQNERAEKDPKHKMALVFRSYLGLSSRWANAGVSDRKMDYQIWCGPAMGAFNAWTQGTFLEAPEARKVDLVAMNMMFGAAVLTRLNWLRTQGVHLPAEVMSYQPMQMADIYKFLQREEV